METSMELADRAREQIIGRQPVLIGCDPLIAMILSSE